LPGIGQEIGAKKKHKEHQAFANLLQKYGRGN
jgi:hypothetical protein